MSYDEIIKDTDAFFDIDPKTRLILNNTLDKVKVMQFDHNSERFTFTVPKTIEGHDMSNCKVSIHYLCIDEKGVQLFTDRYDVKDLQPHPDDDAKLIFSWLISQYVTQYAGLIQFSIRFVCENEDGSVDYAWGTEIFKSISVSWSIYNSKKIFEKYSDVLNQWKREIDEKLNLPLYEGDGNNALIHGRTLSNWKPHGDDNTGINDKVVEYISHNVKNENELPIQIDEDGKVIAGAFGYGSAMFGTKSQALGNKSHAEGSKTIAFANNSHAEGNGTFAVGQHSHAEGSGTTAVGNSSHAEGRDTIAEGDNAHAEGYRASAIGDNSHAEGCDTISAGHRAHAEGFGTLAQNDESHAEGLYTITGGGAQHVQGRWNIVMGGDYAHVVGNGSADDKRSNAHTLDWDGNAWFAGTIEDTGVILKSPNGTRFKLTVQDDGSLLTSKM